MKEQESNIQGLEQQAEAFLAKQPAADAPSLLSARELARQLEDGGKRGWLTPNGQSFPADLEASALDLGGSPSAAMPWKP